MPLSTPALLYLGADALAPKEKRLSMGVDVPCKDTQADLKQLSGILAAAALWSLRESGALTIGIEQKKGLLKTKDRVAVRRTGAPTGNGAVETGLLNAAAEKDPYARDTVVRWLGRDYNDPWGAVAGSVEQELADAGYVTREKAGGLKGKLGARPVATPDCGAIERIRNEVDDAVARWRKFAANEPDLAAALVKEARDGVDARLASD